MRFDPSQWEPFLPDSRLERVLPKLVADFGHEWLQEAELLTLRQPAREITRETDAGVRFQQYVPEMVIFGIIEPNPRRPQQRIMTEATASRAGFDEADQEYRHLVGGLDPVYSIYKILIPVHMGKMADLRALLN